MDFLRGENIFLFTNIDLGSTVLERSCKSDSFPYSFYPKAVLAPFSNYDLVINFGNIFNIYDS